MEFDRVPRSARAYWSMAAKRQRRLHGRSDLIGQQGGIFHMRMTTSLTLAAAALLAAAPALAQNAAAPVNSADMAATNAAATNEVAANTAMTTNTETATVATNTTGEVAVPEQQEKKSFPWGVLGLLGLLGLIPRMRRG